jgi:hypothetical protein
MSAWFLTSLFVWLAVSYICVNATAACGADQMVQQVQTAAAPGWCIGFASLPHVLQLCLLGFIPAAGPATIHVANMDACNSPSRLPHSTSFACCVLQ